MARVNNHRIKLNQPLRLSPSSIGVFRQCHQQYKFLYIDKLGDQYRRAKPFFTMANHVHATLKDFLTTVPVEMRTKETITRLLQKNWLRYQVGFRNHEDEQRWHEKARKQLVQFIEKTDITIKPMTAEWTFESVITPGVVLNGRVDRIDRQADGTLHIIDYKTGNIPEEIEWTQVRLNALAASQNFNLPVSKISYLYLSSCDFTSVNISAEDIDQTNWDLLQVVRAIRNEKYYLPMTGKWCSGCDFRSICPGDPIFSAPPENQLELWDDTDIS